MTNVIRRPSPRCAGLCWNIIAARSQIHGRYATTLAVKLLRVAISEISAALRAHTTAELATFGVSAAAFLGIHGAARIAAPRARQCPSLPDAVSIAANRGVSGQRWNCRRQRSGYTLSAAKTPVKMRRAFENRTVPRTGQSARRSTSATCPVVLLSRMIAADSAVGDLRKRAASACCTLSPAAGCRWVLEGCDGIGDGLWLWPGSNLRT